MVDKDTGLTWRGWRPRGERERCNGHFREPPCKACERLERLADENDAAIRLQGACLAMSRFMTFVWMEALRNSTGNWPEGRDGQMAAREWAFRHAVYNRGLLKVSFP